MNHRSASYTMALFALLFNIFMMSTSVFNVVSAECVDSNKKFKLRPKQKKKRKCYGWKNWCAKGNKKVKMLCPVTCKLCPCEDTKGKFQYSNNTKKRCSVAKKKKRFCGQEVFKDKCPLTCGLCKILPTTPPTSSPTTTPTSSPTAAPTSSPTAAPTSSPSTAPTLSCTLTGTMAFPAVDEAMHYGYHSDNLQATKAGKKKVCGSENKKVWWGCVHEGFAKLENFVEYTSSSQSESVTIERAAGNSYRIKVEHNFDVEETYYTEDHTMAGELTIKINDNVLGIYSHPDNSNTDSHNQDKSVNAAYKGIIYVNVDCNQQCDCSAQVILPTCTIRAELKFPSIEDAPEYGYHNDFVTVKKEGENDNCSYYSTPTTWCTHEGDAQIYNYESQNYYDFSESEAIVIPEAAGEKFQFKIEHYFSMFETYYPMDHMMPGDLTLWINGQNKGTYSHEVSKTTTTHLADNTINPDYTSEIYLDVECDDLCVCTVAKRNEAACEIKARVQFAKKKFLPYEGHHSDSVSVEKVGEEVICERGEGTQETGWGCLHNGKIAQISNWKEDDGDFSRDGEIAIVKNGIGGNFRFSLHHNFKDEEQKDGYPDDHKMVGNMTILINNFEMGIYSHPKNFLRDTHLDDGTINPDYTGKIYVDVKCDSDCNCDIKKHQPKCEIVAELKFSNFKDKDYGYHNDYFTVSEEGRTEECGYYNSMTSWGCIHKGDAYILDYADDQYLDYNEAETVNIPDATSGNFIFKVEHYYTSYDKEFDEDHKNPAELTITINEEVKGTFSHPKNKDQETHNSDGTINENYEGTITVGVSCTDKCDCVLAEK